MIVISRRLVIIRPVGASSSNLTLIQDRFCYLLYTFHVSSREYRSEIIEIMGFIENILDSVLHTDVIILSDIHFPINYTNPGFVIMNSLLNCYNILLYDDLLCGLDQATYVNVALNCSSTIDHCFVSQGLHDLVSDVSIIDSAINLSDHRPLHLHLDINWSKANISLAHSYRMPVAYKVRWDKGSLGNYYRVTGEALSSLRPSSLGLSCSPGVNRPPTRTPLTVLKI